MTLRADSAQYPAGKVRSPSPRTTNLLMVGVNHHTALIEVRERLARRALSLDPNDILDENITEAVILSTCNRVELYAVVNDVSMATESLSRLLLGTNEEADLQVCVDGEVVNHLFNVASGLDSLVVGEAQILNQVKGAIARATTERIARKELSMLFKRAIRVGSRVREETEVGSRNISIGSVVVQAIDNEFSTLRDRSILLVGTGKMIRLVASNLRDKGIRRIVVTGKSLERTKSISDRLGGEAAAQGSIDQVLPGVDIVITATTSISPIISVEQVKEAISNRNNGLLLIDLAVPRNIDHRVGALEGAHLYNIDDLRPDLVTVSDESRISQIIQEEATSFQRWKYSLKAEPIIRALREDSELLRLKETSRALRLLNLSKGQQIIINNLTRKIVNSILHSPTVRLRKYAADKESNIHLETAKELFRLRDENNDGGT